MNIVYCLVYVDDLILTGTNLNLLSNIIGQLSNEVAFKDLSPLCYFLGIEVSSSPTGLHLLQSKYIWKLLSRVNMHEATSVNTPSSPLTLLYKYFSHNFKDPKLYREVLGMLQYTSLYYNGGK